MNKTGKPINLSKYPLIEKCYNLVRDIDSLPASTEATFLVVKAGELMDEVWNYLEAHQSRLSGVLQESLTAKYKGKKIKNPYTDVEFVVDYVEVTPTAPDPQMNVILASEKYKNALKAVREWNLKNNPMGNNPPPQEIIDPWTASNGECVMMSNVDDVLPEVMG